jgi:hypothetical protein
LGLRLVRFTVIPAFVAASVLSGCGEDSPTKPPPGGGGPPTYPVLSSPQNVLAALEIAYSSRDSMETKALYDSSYVGRSEDLSDPYGTPLSFTYYDEVRHVSVMRRSTTISHVVLDFGTATSWIRLGSDDPSHPEWAVIQIAGSNLDVQVTEGNEAYQAGGSNEFLEFRFKPTTPASTSPTDTLWKIVRWMEIRQP